MNTERLGAINSYIQSRGEARISELSALFPNVSTMTIRRDIDYLEKQGYIVRTRGGAKAVTASGPDKEDAYSLRMRENMEAKDLIASKAIGFVEKERSMFFDSGTTVLCLAKLLPNDNFFVLTSGPSTALEIVRNTVSTVILTGGRLNSDNLSLSGAGAIETARSINVDTAFMAASGYSVGSGFTCGDFDECELKRLIIGKARRIVLLMDTSKLDRQLPYTFARMEDIDCLVCEHELPEEIKREAQQGNTQLI